MTGNTFTIGWGSDSDTCTHSSDPFWKVATSTANTASVTCNDYMLYLRDVNAALIQDIQTYYVRSTKKRRRRIPDPDPIPTVRQPPPLEFNKYINGSDLLEEFLGFLKTHKVTQQEALRMPLQTFIQWLIVEAAKADKEDPPTQVQLPARTVRCLSCQRFVARANAAKLCNALCAQRYFAKAA